jgi:hypothetical protein
LPGLKTLSAIRLELLTDETLPQHGPGRADNGNLHLSEFQVLLFEPGASSAHPVTFASASADFNQSGWTIDHALDGNEKTAWGVHPQVGQSHHAIFRLAPPLALPDNARLGFVLKQLHGGNHVIGRFRLALTGESSPAALVAIPEEIESILRRAKSERTDDERAALAQFLVRRRIAAELARLPRPSLVYAAASDFEPDGGHKPAGGPRVIHVLKRGDILRP